LLLLHPGAGVEETVVLPAIGDDERRVVDDGAHGRRRAGRDDPARKGNASRPDAATPKPGPAVEERNRPSAVGDCFSRGQHRPLGAAFLRKNAVLG